MIFNFGAAIVCLEEKYFSAISHDQGWSWKLELTTNLSEDFTITEKAPAKAFSWSKVPTSAFTFKTLC